MFKRPGTPADVFPPPDAFPNDAAAVAAMGKAPPDMNLLAKSLKYERGFPTFVFDIFTTYQEMGADFIYAILNGYTKPDDPQWNLYYPGHKIAMPQPITDGAVKYADGTPPTLQNYAKDISSFLTWAAEPKMVERKKIGFRVIIFLIVLSSLLYLTKRKIWATRTDRRAIRRFSGMRSGSDFQSRTPTDGHASPRSVRNTVLDLSTGTVSPRRPDIGRLRPSRYLRSGAGCRRTTHRLARSDPRPRERRLRIDRRS